MRIAQVSTLATPVTGGRCGSVESLVYGLSKELTARGHEVTVFACGGSEVPCELAETLPGPYGHDGGISDWQVCEWVNLCAAVAASARRSCSAKALHAFSSGPEPATINSASMSRSLVQA